jgi:hypothetical protein
MLPENLSLLALSVDLLLLVLPGDLYLLVLPGDLWLLMLQLICSCWCSLVICCR